MTATPDVGWEAADARHHRPEPERITAEDVAEALGARVFVVARNGETSVAWYLDRPPAKDVPEGMRLVHNFYPCPLEDPDRAAGADGFRYWLTDQPNANERRCYCGWLDGREHYGTVSVVDDEREDATWPGDEAA